VFFVLSVVKSGLGEDEPQKRTGDPETAEDGRSFLMAASAVSLGE
jgi:hypothetical protein